MPSAIVKLIVGIEGIQAVQTRNIMRIQSLTSNGPLEALAKRVTVYTHSQAIKVTHVDTGTLRASHRMQVRGKRGRVFIDPDAVNPQSGEKPVDYGPIEHSHGPTHAFYMIARVRAASFFKKEVQIAAKKVVNP
ncbi:MAG: hypothetical protein AAF485_10110 [Chloroflexota bacterium]